MSLFVSFTLTPLLASRMARKEELTNKTLFGRFILLFERFITNVTDTYGQVLAYALGKKRYVIIGTIIVVISSFMLVGKGYIGTEFVSQGDTSEFIVNLELAQNATLAQTNDAVQKAEEHLFKNADVKNVFSSIGTASNAIGGSNSTNNKAEINVKLVPREQREVESSIYAQYMKLELEKILPGVKVSSAAVSITGGANQAPVQMAVTGNDLNQNFKISNELIDHLKSIKGTAEVKMSIESGNPEVSVDINREKMAELGLSMDVIGMTMQAAFSGNSKASYTDQGKDYDINVMYDNFDRRNEGDLASLVFINNRGENIRLEQFANIGRSTGPTKLERKNRVPSITISSQVLGVSSGTVTGEMTKFIKKKNYPSSVVVSFEGNSKNMGEAFANLGFALIASILFVYLIMVALYDSYVYPFVVLFSIPVAVVGALLALALSMQPLSIFSMLGMIMLIGLVAKNAILIVDFANQLKAEGRNTVEALIASGKTRLRPILMTTLSMITGMMPIAMAHGPGAEWKSGLAWVLIGGLTSSMILTLVVVPSVYMIFDVFKKDIKNKEGKAQLKIIRKEGLDVAAMLKEHSAH